MTIHLPNDLENSVRSLVPSKRNALADEMINRLVEEDTQRSQQLAGSSQDSTDQWTRRLHAWVDAHPSRSLVIDDSRESIYAGRGE